MKHRISIGIFLILAVVLYILKAESWQFILLLLCFGLVTFLGVTNIDFHWFLKSFTHKKNMASPTVAITFDDGPTEYTPKFLEIIKEKQQKATFFCIGKQIEKHPEIFRDIVKEGHEIGNHTFSHSNKTGILSTKSMIEEILKNDSTILKIGNLSTQLYRPPFGITNPQIARAIKKTNKKSIGWNIRSFDTAIQSEEKIVQRILPRIKPGSIILLHDTSEKTLRVLHQLLLFLEQKKWRSVTISELLKEQIKNEKIHSTVRTIGGCSIPCPEQNDTARD